MRRIPPSAQTRYSLLALNRLYFLRCTNSIMTRLCPLRTVSDAFHNRRKHSRIYHVDAPELSMPSKKTMQTFVHMMMSQRASPLMQEDVRRLVILLDYMGCNHKATWNLVAHSIRFDVFDEPFLDTMQTIAHHCDYEPIANLAAHSKHVIPLHLFPRDSDVYHALLCIASEKTPTHVPDDALDSVEVDVDAAFPGLKLKQIMEKSSFVTGVIAGGAICGHLTGFRGSDIDIFLWNADHGNVYEMIRVIQNVHPGSTYTVTKHTITVTLPNIMTPLQIIPFQPKMSGTEIVHYFDLDPCCCFIPWAKDRIYIHPRAQWALKTRTMDLRNAPRFVCTVRIEKYKTRGFGLGCMPSDIFVSGFGVPSTMEPAPHLQEKCIMSIYCMTFLHHRLQLLMGYRDSRYKYKISSTWLEARNDRLDLTRKPWCKGLCGNEVIYTCRINSKYCKTGHQVIFGVIQ